MFAVRLEQHEPKMPPFFDRDIWEAITAHPDLYNLKSITLVTRLRYSDTQTSCSLALYISEFCQSANPRDAVYGLSGILSERIVLDYKKNLVDVYKDCVIAILRD